MAATRQETRAEPVTADREIVISRAIGAPREVGLVWDRKAGKQRIYGLDARGLKPVHEWTGGFERFWNESFDRLDSYVQDLKQTQQEE